MANERNDGTDITFTDDELDMFTDFDAEMDAGRKPDIEEYLARCPGSEAKMRPILEMACLLDREIRQFRRKYPHVDLRKLSGLAGRSRRGENWSE